MKVYKIKLVNGKFVNLCEIGHFELEVEEVDFNSAISFPTLDEAKELLKGIKLGVDGLYEIINKHKVHSIVECTGF